MLNTHYWTEGLKMPTNIILKSKSRVFFFFTLIISIIQPWIWEHIYSSPSSKIKKILRQEKKKTLSCHRVSGHQLMEQTVLFGEWLKTQTGETAILSLLLISLQHISTRSADGRDPFAKDLNGALMTFGWWILTKEQIVVRFVSFSVFPSAWAQTSAALFPETGHIPHLKNEP